MVKFSFKPRFVYDWTEITISKTRIQDENLPEIPQRPQFMGAATIDWYYVNTCPVCKQNIWKIFELMAEFPLTFSVNFRCSTIPKAMLQSTGRVRIGGFEEGPIRFIKDETFDLTAATRLKKILRTEEFPLTAIKEENTIPPKIAIIPGYDKDHNGVVWSAAIREKIERKMGISNIEKTLELYQKLTEIKSSRNSVNLK